MREQNRKRNFFALKLVFFLAVGILLGTGSSNYSASAASGYQIKINKQANCVTIYKKDASGKYKAVKAMVCSTGVATNLGTFSLGEKMRWHTLDGPCYGQYCTRIYGGVLFHSVWYTGYNDPSTLSISSYNKLGTTASHGCVRLTVADAQWIYDNVPSGTQVVIYSSSNPGPLGKPKAIKLPSTYGWDPTDIWNPKNPWNNKKPSISGVKNQTVDFGASFNIMKGVTAKNTTGFDARALVKTKVTYSGKTVSKVDTKMPGTYKVKYTLVDEIGRKATASAKITVRGAKEKPVITGVEKVYVTSKSKLTKKFLLKNVTVKQGGKKLADQYVKVTLKKTETNVYTVTYTAQNSSLPAVVKTKAYIDKKAPVISGVTNGKSYNVDASQKITVKYAKSLVTKVSDNYTKVKKSDLVIKITKQNSGAKYKVVYTLKDQAGNKCTVTIYLVPVNFVTIEGPSSIKVDSTTLGYSSNATATQIKNALMHYLLNQAGFKAYTYDKKNLTDAILLELTDKGNDSYTATLSVSDGKGHSAKKKVKVTVKRKDFFAFEGAEDRTVTGAAIGIYEGEEEEVAKEAVKSYVEGLGITASQLISGELVVPSVTEIVVRENKYYVTLTAEDQEKNAQTTVLCVTVSFEEP